MRDQFEDLRKRMADSSVRLKRQKLNLAWDNPAIEELRPVAEEIWQLAYNTAVTLADLHGQSSFCDWKIYRTVDELVRSGHFAFCVNSEEPQLVDAGS